MQWQQLKGGFLIATVESGDSVDEAMIELCDEIKRKVIPMNSEVTWNYLRVEIWSDSGRIIVFPSASSSEERIEKAGCQVVFEDLLSDFETLADSDLNDDQFTAELLRVEKSWAVRLLVAARHQGLQGYRFQFRDSESPYPFHDETI